MCGGGGGGAFWLPWLGYRRRNLKANAAAQLKQCLLKSAVWRMLAGSGQAAINPPLSGNALALKLSCKPRRQWRRMLCGWLKRLIRQSEMTVAKPG